MLRPDIAARVKKQSEQSGRGVNGFDAIVFAAIATRTSEGEVVKFRRTAQNFWDDVFAFEGVGAEIFGRDAVFAATLRPRPQNLGDGFIHWANWRDPNQASIVAATRA